MNPKWSAVIVCGKFGVRSPGGLMALGFESLADAQREADELNRRDRDYRQAGQLIDLCLAAEVPEREIDAALSHPLMPPDRFQSACRAALEQLAAQYGLLSKAVPPAPSCELAGGTS